MKIKKSEVRYIIWVTITLIITCCSVTDIFAQSAENSQEKNKARISLDYYRINNTSQKLVASVKSKVEGFYIPVSGVKIQFYRDHQSEENLLEAKRTGENGEAIIELKLDPDTALWTTYLAILENDPNYKDADDEIEIKKGIINLETEEIDSIKTIRIFVGTPDTSGNVIPLEEVDVRAYVTRLYGLMPVTEEFESTNEDGYFETEFASGIPGDASGHLILVARVNDHDELGNLEFSKSINWGVPLRIDQTEQVKELWLSHSNVPIILIGIINLLLLGILGIIGYVIYQLFQIKKLGLSK